jgi:hypothetical protein
MAPTTIFNTVGLSEFQALFLANPWRAGLRTNCLKSIIQLALGDLWVVTHFPRRQKSEDEQIAQMNDIHYFMNSQAKCQAFFAPLNGRRAAAPACRHDTDRVSANHNRRSLHSSPATIS